MRHSVRGYMVAKDGPDGKGTVHLAVCDDLDLSTAGASADQALEVLVATLPTYFDDLFKTDAYDKVIGKHERKFTFDKDVPPESFALFEDGTFIASVELRRAIAV